MDDVGIGIADEYIVMDGSPDIFDAGIAVARCLTCIISAVA